LGDSFFSRKRYWLVISAQYSKFIFFEEQNLRAFGEKGKKVKPNVKELSQLFTDTGR